jgi:hypothetical protein
MAAGFAIVTIARPGKPPRSWRVPEGDQYLTETEADLEAWYEQEGG